jgi:hypothetical protein
MCAVSAYGANTISSPIQLGGGSFAPSTKVNIAVDSGATSYGAFSVHLSGDHLYATTSAAPNFWYKTVPVGSGFNSNTVSSTMSLDSSTWSSM